MGTHRLAEVLAAALAAALLLAPSAARAGDKEDREEMQKKLNKEVMEKDFSVADTAEVDAYVADAMKKDLKPEQKPPAVWRHGYTCRDLLQYPNNYYNYRNCLHYHRYHGHYWQ